MSYIIIGKYQFNAETLKTGTLKDAINKNNHIDKRVVEQAYNKANPKRSKKKKLKD